MTITDSKPDLRPPARPEKSRRLPPSLSLLFLGELLAVIAAAAMAYGTLRQTNDASAAGSHALEVQRAVLNVSADLTDAETGQRGYLLTGEQTYLDPYNRARSQLAGSLATLRDLVKGNAQSLARADRIASLSEEKIDELKVTIELRRAGKSEQALALVETDRGKNLMDQIRAEQDLIQGNQDDQFRQSQASWQQAAKQSFVVALGSSLVLFVLILIGATVMSRDYRARELQIWVRVGQARLGQKLQGEQRLETLSERVLEFLAGYLDAKIGTLYVQERDGRFRRHAGFALSGDQRSDVVRPGDGLLGQAARENRVLRIDTLPQGYLTAASSLGSASPVELLILPASVDGVVQGVIELGFLERVSQHQEELLTRVSEQLGVALRSAKDRDRLEELLEETQRQSEELQTQQEELRVANEELTEHGDALRTSQAQMESQQVELEQTNAQLEEQTQMLERQRDDLVAAQLALTQKAAELASASEYKSQFLANMSHELRTPLNSTLILARLLADNKPGNLTAEQMKYAQTIASAGTDLLALINDILDLAKIEAGKIDVVVEHIHLGRTLDVLIKTFTPVAQQAGLTFTATLAPGTVDHIDTDSRRLGQILRNLLSNAIKFTPSGGVTLRILSSDEMVTFEVSDTGVGIAAEQQQVVFQAFRQADGSTHRRFGGTGLGLSISRDLARLLGGGIGVRSAQGEGSVFTLTLPKAYRGKPEPVAALAPPPVERRRYETTSTMTAPALIQVGIEDDRTQLQADKRLILIIEDDTRFAEILRDMAHENQFQCVVTHTAKDGLDAAAKYKPGAILLDINLPDQSGLVVLDEIKRQPALRHIPVHIVSVADHSHEALARGAIGYALKPVKREEIMEAFQRLDAKLSQVMRRILVIEDDPEQRLMIRQLLGGADIEIVEVDTAEDAAQRLANSTFDCMILDLSLPDATGLELLERMSQNGDLSFPPTIIYTGQAVTPEQEQSLRRFSHSIILKGARSPERLLDEVMLFLHRVESNLPPESQRMLKAARSREAALEDRRILIVEDDVRNIFALSSVLEPLGAKIEIARNGKEALNLLDARPARGSGAIDLVLMDIMMPEMDGFTAMHEIRKRSEWSKLPIIALTAKAMQDDQEKCLAAGANDYIAKPLDVEKLLSLIRVWLRK
ncbi:MAG TPA: response regulator [Rudaea sp.]|jgi:CheY-like chemotaxis protein/CHASE3 domain sensor protein